MTAPAKTPGGTAPDSRRIRQIIIPAIILAIIIVIVLLASLVFTTLPAAPAEPDEPLTIASGTLESSALTVIAVEKDYFSIHGLNVTIVEYPSGALAMKELLAGRADIAYASEFVGVSNRFLAPDLRIIATTAKNNNIYLVFRSSRGITTPSDLKGRTVAIPKGTAAEFFLARYLTMNGMDLADITPRYLAPADVVTSVVSGESDTAIVWDPYVYQIQQQLGPDNTTWNAQGGQKYYWVAFTREDMIRSRPSGIRKYLRALGEAEAFIDSHPSEAQEIHRRRMNTTSEYGDRIWQQNQFLLTLDQALIVAMEDEARWMAAQNLTGGNTTPSYLDMVYQDAMRETWPSAVTIIR